MRSCSRKQTKNPRFTYFKKVRQITVQLSILSPDHVFAIIEVNTAHLHRLMSMMIEKVELVTNDQLSIFLCDHSMWSFQKPQPKPYVILDEEANLEITIKIERFWPSNQTIFCFTIHISFLDQNRSRHVKEFFFSSFACNVFDEKEDFWEDVHMNFWWKLILLKVITSTKGFILKYHNAQRLKITKMSQMNFHSKEFFCLYHEFVSSCCLSW